MSEEQLSLVLALAVAVIAGSFAVISWSAAVGLQRTESRGA